MDYDRSNMAIIDAPLVKIEISILDRNLGSTLQLNYHGQRYDLVQAFASHKLELAQQRWQQQIAVDDTVSGRYLLVREVDYYSLWRLDRSVNPACLIRAYNHHNLELQQASIWLFQELWLQWQDLLGEGQLHIFADDLLDLNLPLRSRADLDRLLSLDPLADEPLSSWTQADFIAFDRQLSDLTQHKMGQKFGHKLTIEIIESMPDSLRAILTDTLNPKSQSDIFHHD
jgi:hypothetical protein